MSTRRDACVVVDAYSTGSLLPRAFAAYGCASIHVASGRNLPDALRRTFRSADFLDDLTYDSDIDVLCKELLAIRQTISCVVAASEPGVLLADELSERLGVPTNGTALSPARRDKSIMARTVADAGLPVIPHLVSSEPSEILEWIGERGLEEVVVKPLASSGTVGFHICRGDDDITRTVHDVLGTRDVFGAAIDRLLVQPFVDGEEYCVNAVSCGGHHLVSEVWRTKKRRRGGSKVYDLETLVDPSCSTYRDVTGYVQRVLTALGICFGPSHTEVIVSPAGTVLIESAARFMGALDISLVSRATGTNAVLLTAEAYLVPERFLARLDDHQPPLGCGAAMVQMISTTEGTLCGYDLEALASLETFHGVDTYLAPGDALVETVDSFSSPGLVFLAGPTAESLQRDYELIRAMEARGQLYEVAA